MFSQIAQNLPPGMAEAWAGNAAKNLMLGIAPGGVTDGILKTLGSENPSAPTPLGQALGMEEEIDEEHPAGSPC